MDSESRRPSTEAGQLQFSAGQTRSRGSSPKLVLGNNALISATSLHSLEDLRSNTQLWGRWVENAVGAHLLNHLQGLPYEITYWRHRNDEVDYVVRVADALWAVEVKSGRLGTVSGLETFAKQHPQARRSIVGEPLPPLPPSRTEGVPEGVPPAPRAPPRPSVPLEPSPPGPPSWPMVIGKSARGEAGIRRRAQTRIRASLPFMLSSLGERACAVRTILESIKPHYGACLQVQTTEGVDIAIGPTVPDVGQGTLRLRGE